MNKRQWLVVAGLVVVAAGVSNAKGWDKKYIGALPDSSFASVETGPQGEKLRHLPFRDESGKVDQPHLKAALRSWKHVKWQNPADAQPALGLLKNEESKLCASGQMKCGSSPKKPKQAKAKKPRIKHSSKTASAKPAPAPKVAKAPKQHKARHVAKVGPKPAKAPKVAKAPTQHKPRHLAKAGPKPAKTKIARKPRSKQEKAQPKQA